jgi:parallel beta-helix repeat protein
MKGHIFTLMGLLLFVCTHISVAESHETPKLSKSGITITVGVENAAIVGSDNRALQAAVDYAAALGGGTVHIGPGVYEMKDSLHLRSNVAVVGAGEKTVLRKGNGHISRLATDGDYGEEQITVEDPSGFEVGMGVTVQDDHSGGFHTTVGTIIAQIDENTFRVSTPLQADCMVHNNAIANNAFPIISAYYAENIRIEGLTIDGNKANNEYLNGCRGAGVFFYRVNNSQIIDCIVHDYNGDGISFQQSNDITVENCVSHNNGGLGFHPGSGSQRPTMRNNLAYENDDDGLFLCWRVRHGVFEGNELRNNGRYGISIGHKDSDNLLRNNIVVGNALHGVYFRDEPEYTGGHRNRLEGNQIYNNGAAGEGSGVYVDGETNDIVIVGNQIGNRAEIGNKTQRFGVVVGPKAKRVKLQENQIDGNLDGDVQKNNGGAD